MLARLSHSTAAVHLSQQLLPPKTQLQHCLNNKRKDHQLAPLQRFYYVRGEPFCCRAAGDSLPTGSGAGGSGPPTHQSKRTAEEGDGDGYNKPDTAARKWPRWYTVWIWATALTYLVWRFKWRRDRRLAAEQFAHEQQQEAELKQEWIDFAKSYGVKTPQDNSNT